MDSNIITWAIIGAIIGLVVVVITFFVKEQRYNKLLKSVTVPIEYNALYHYSSAKRFRSSMKFFDSFGLLYMVGDKLYYKTTESGSPMVFDLKQCKVEMEKDWRWMKWFSITAPTGDKFYFNSHKMGAFKNNSDETVRGFNAIKAKTAA